MAPFWGREACRRCAVPTSRASERPLVRHLRRGRRLRPARQLAEHCRPGRTGRGHRLWLPLENSSTDLRIPANTGCGRGRQPPPSEFSELQGTSRRGRKPGRAEPSSRPGEGADCHLGAAGAAPHLCLEGPFCLCFTMSSTHQFSSESSGCL